MTQAPAVYPPVRLRPTANRASRSVGSCWGLSRFASNVIGVGHSALLIAGGAGGGDGSAGTVRVRRPRSEHA